ncbi:hypothetical protein LR48_Vigan04g049700 [Vigna angularis]|uniref:Uncharacterized protein n=1 Tax=Phaseolus angularis TaxID=3914 RepID=A0A0L9UCP1_PHAAN|nr:hypothetical protein LR48_Vigan04g049700 [Vigna angularis]
MHTRHLSLEASVSEFEPVALLSSVTHLLLLRFTFQNHRNVRPAVIFHLDRTELGSELRSTSCRAFVSKSVRPHVERSSLIAFDLDDGGASLEQMLEEENLDETNLVEVDVKAEP